MTLATVIMFVVSVVHFTLQYLFMEDSVTMDDTALLDDVWAGYDGYAPTQMDGGRTETYFRRLLTMFQYLPVVNVCLPSVAFAFSL